MRALVKLEQVPPSHLRRRVRALGSATIAPTVGGPTVDPQDLTTIAAACRDHERLRFSYRSREGIDSRREVEPHSLVNLGRRWYVVARGPKPRGLAHLPRRSARASRGDRAPVHAARVTCPGRGCLRRAEHHGGAAPLRGQGHDPRPADEVAARVPAYWGTVEEKDARSCELRIGDDDLGWLAVRLAMIPVEFEVH